VLKDRKIPILDLQSSQGRSKLFLYERYLNKTHFLAQKGSISISRHITLRFETCDFPLTPLLVYLNSTVFFFSLLEKDDSCNGSKTQSATTTESNTPENTVRLDNIPSNRNLNYHFAENGEMILDSECQYPIVIH
jgi:hypothetical protein